MDIPFSLKGRLRVRTDSQSYPPLATYSVLQHSITMLAAASQYFKTAKELLQEANVFLEEALSLLMAPVANDPLLQQHQARYAGYSYNLCICCPYRAYHFYRLHTRAEALSANNSLQGAKALRKEAVEFRDEVRQHRDNLRLVCGQQLSPASDRFDPSSAHQEELNAPARTL
jgi:hypothetical protein